MRYKALDGVVLSKVCNENLLVATRQVWGKCPYVKSLSPLAASFWKGIQLGYSDEQMVQELLKSSTIKESAIRNSLDRFLSEMTAEGYLFPEEEQA